MLFTRYNSLINRLVGSAVGSSADDEGPQGARNLVVIAGQSNAVGEGWTPNLTTLLRTGVGSTYSNVRLKQQTAQSTTTPITWSTGPVTSSLANYSSTVASPVNGKTSQLFGIECSLGRHLDFYKSQFDLVKLAVAGSDLNVMWNTTGTYPNGGTSDNLFNQLVAFMHAAETELSGSCKVFVWIQGEADAGDATMAANYQTNLTALFNAIRAIWPGISLVFLQLNNGITAANKATVRAAQATVAGLFSNCTMLNADDLSVDATGHYSADGYAVLGDRFGDAVVSLLGLTNPLAWTVDRYSLIGIPQNLAEWQAVFAAANQLASGMSGKQPNMLWLFDGLASGNVSDPIGGFTGTAANTPGYNVALPGTIGWKSNTFKTTNGIAGCFNNTSASLPDPTTTSQAVMIYTYVQDLTATANMSLDATAGFSTIQVLNTHTWQAGDNANTSLATTSPYGNMRPFIRMRDKTNTVLQGYTEAEKSGAGTPGTVTGKKVQLGLATTGQALAQHIMRVDFHGTNAEMTTAQWRALLQTLGWGNAAMGGTAIPW